MIRVCLIIITIIPEMSKQHVLKSMNLYETLIEKSFLYQ